MTSMVATAQATVQAVETRANELVRGFDLVRVLLILLSLPFIVIGWVAQKAFRVLVIAGAWVWAAAETGWQAGKKKSDKGR